MMKTGHQKNQPDVGFELSAFPKLPGRQTELNRQWLNQFCLGKEITIKTPKQRGEDSFWVEHSEVLGSWCAQRGHKSSLLLPNPPMLYTSLSLSNIFHKSVNLSIFQSSMSCFSKLWNMKEGVAVVAVAKSRPNCTHQAFLSITISLSLLRLMSIESVMPSNHLILCHPLLLPPSIFPSISLFQGVRS